MCLCLFSNDFILLCVFNQTFQSIFILRKGQNNASWTHGVLTWPVSHLINHEVEIVHTAETRLDPRSQTHHFLTPGLWDLIYIYILYPPTHIYICTFVFLRPYPWHMEVARLGVKSELQLQANTTATAMWDL